MDEGWIIAQLRDAGLVTEQQLATSSGRGWAALCAGLLHHELVAEDDLLRIVSTGFNTRYVTVESLSGTRIPQWVLNLLPVDMCEQFCMLPVRCDRQRTALSIVSANPGDDRLRELVRKNRVG